MSILINFNYFKPSGYYNPDDDYFMKRFLPRHTIEGVSQVVSDEYKNYSEDFLLLSRWTSEKPSSLPDSKFTSETVNILSIEKTSPVKYRISIDPKDEGTVVFNSYYFPGWVATADGKSISLSPLSPYGNVALDIPAGVSQIDVYWRETPLRIFADLLSLAALAGILIIISKYKNKTLG